MLVLTSGPGSSKCLQARVSKIILYDGALLVSCFQMTVNAYGLYCGEGLSIEF